MLLKLFLNLITLGAYNRLEKKHDNLKESVGRQSTNESDGLHVAQVMALDTEIKKAKEAADRYDSKPPKMVPVEYYDICDQEYLSGISEVFNSKYFRYFLHNVQQDIYSLQVSAEPSMAVELIGMVKGVAHLTKILNATEKRHLELLSPPEDNEDKNYA